MRRLVEGRPSASRLAGVVADGGVSGRVSWRLRLALLVTLVATPPAAAEEPHRLLGVSSCASAGCHAAAEAGHAPWQSAFTVWATRDPHSQAHRALEGPVAERIVAAIAARSGGRPQPAAREHPACVACHAPGLDAARREGVGCETCHGAAGEWVVAHTLPGWTTRGNSAGMVDLADPATCARTCVPCHVGGAPHADGSTMEVSHDLIAAGHPRLAFELRGFKAGVPPHWRDRVALAAAGAAPAADVDPLAEWSTGRLVVLEAYLAQTARQAAAAPGATQGLLADTWPELTAFDCYGCHRQPVAAGDRGQPVAASRGRLRLEPAVWSLLDVAAPDAGAELNALGADIAGAWWWPPDPARLTGTAERLAALTAAGRPPGHAPSRALVERVAAATDPANWDEVVATLAFLEAVLDHHRSRAVPAARVAAPAAALADLRRVLAFEAHGVGAARVRFANPRGHDPSAVRGALTAAAALVGSLGEPREERGEHRPTPVGGQ
jgi:hypothetical protein